MCSSSLSENEPEAVSAAATWPRVVGLLDEALDLPPAERAAFLDAACDEDWLREEVESLLEAHEEAGTLFETPAVGQARTLLGSLEGRAVREEDFVAGQRVGPYRIVRPLGRGGMGVVYLAERADGTFEKAMALKVIKRGMDTDEVVRRFRYERQILARLDHPHIARLYDGGVTGDGRPYFVMECVEGRSIDRYCDEERLGVGARLQLFATVCEAVQYAHQNLVVHRDLKPSNILVNADGEVRLLDFGIAKLVDPDDNDEVPLTRMGYQAITPEYAAPEQLTGEGVTTATDVYALGVVLYQLLVGCRPYQIESRALTDIERVIREETPSRPSIAVERDEDVGRHRNTTSDQLRRHLRGDLDAIVMKALEKEPGRRYQTAGDLVQDLWRYRARLPVRARSDVYGYYAASYRLGKFVRRNKATVAAVLITLVTLAGGLATTLWQARIAAQERDQKQLEAEQKQLALEYVIGTFDDLSPEQAQNHMFTGEDVVQAGLRRLEGLRGQPQLEAQITSVLGRISFSLGEWGQADSLLRASLSIQRQSGAPEEELAATKEALGHAASFLYEFEEAERLFREVLPIQEKAHGPGSPGLVGVLNGLGQALYAQSDSAKAREAETIYRRAIAIGRAQDESGEDQLTESLTRLADLLTARERYEEAEALYREAWDIRRRVLGPAHVRTGETIYSLAQHLVVRDVRREEASVLYGQALDIFRSAHGDDHQFVGLTLYGMALLEHRSGDRAAAEDHYRQAANTIGRAMSPEHMWVALPLLNLGRLYIEEGRFADGERVLRRSVSIFNLQGDDEDSRLALARGLLGVCLAGQGELAAAEEALTAGYEVLRTKPARREDTALVLEHLVRLYERQGNAARADRYRRLLLQASAPSSDE